MVILCRRLRLDGSILTLFSIRSKENLFLYPMKLNIVNIPNAPVPSSFRQFDRCTEGEIEVRLVAIILFSDFLGDALRTSFKKNLCSFSGINLRREASNNETFNLRLKVN